MLKINRMERTLSALESRQLHQAGLRERFDLQAMIRNSPEIFFKEMGEQLLLLAEEYKPVTFVDDRIDLLALDKDGAVVVIELKRGNHRFQLLQALAYASMVSDASHDDLIKLRAQFAHKLPHAAQEELEEFLEDDPENINETQRIILVAEEYDYEVLTTAKWLNQQYRMDIRCYRLGLSSDAAADYLTCTCIFPPKELAQHAINRKRAGGGVTRELAWTSWNEALKSIRNEAVAQFFRDEIAKNRECYLRRRILRFRDCRNVRRWHITARADRAYVWQNGRFESDVEFWNESLGSQADATPVKEDTCVRFFLRSDQDFKAFREALDSKLRNVEFSADAATDAAEGED